MKNKSKKIIIIFLLIVIIAETILFAISLNQKNNEYKDLDNKYNELNEKYDQISIVGKTVASLGEYDIKSDSLYEKMRDYYALSILIDIVDKELLNSKYPKTDEETEYIKNMKEETKLYYDVYYAQQYRSYESYLEARFLVSSEDELDDVFSLDFKRNKAALDYAKSIITDNEIKDYYDNEYIPDMELSQIFIKSIEDEEDESLRKVNLVIETLEWTGDFTTLAKKYSEDEKTASNGGAMGRVRYGMIDEELLEAASKLKVNEYTKEPIKTEKGFYIILKTKEYEKKDFKDAKDEILEIMASKKANEDYYIRQKALVKLRKDNKFEIEDSNLKTQYKEYEDMLY